MVDYEKEKILKYVKEGDFEIRLSVKMFMYKTYPKYPDKSKVEKRISFYYYITFNAGSDPKKTDLFDNWSAYLRMKKKKWLYGYFEKDVEKALEKKAKLFSNMEFFPIPTQGGIAPVAKMTKKAQKYMDIM